MIIEDVIVLEVEGLLNDFEAVAVSQSFSDFGY